MLDDPAEKKLRAIQRLDHFVATLGAADVETESKAVGVVRVRHLQRGVNEEDSPR